MRRALDRLSGRSELAVAASLFAMGVVEALFLAPDAPNLRNWGSLQFGLSPWSGAGVGRRRFSLSWS